MTTINLSTKIKAPIEIIFDLSRNIDIHKLSINQTNEKAIDGVTSGLINLNETVTFRGKHFGIYLQHKSKITQMEIPNYFIDEMVKGHFKFFHHKHIFIQENEYTIMKDELTYKVPFGILGKLIDFILVKKHLTKLILKRNKFLKELAENNQK